jgi:hypothetical protein
MSDDNKRSGEPWWAALLVALILFGITIGLYVDLTAWEASGGTRQMHWILALLYRWLGKWGMVGLCALIGMGVLYHGISKLRTILAERPPARRKKKKRVESLSAEE